MADNENNLPFTLLPLNHKHSTDVRSGVADNLIVLHKDPAPGYERQDICSQIRR